MTTDFDAVGIFSNCMLFLLIAGMAGSCDPRVVLSRVNNWRGLAMGIVCQFLLLPFLGFLSLSIFPQPDVYAITLLIVTTSPGGGFSGFWCSLCNADLALSIAMTTASTIVSLVALPLNAFLYLKILYGTTVYLEWTTLATDIIIVVGAVIFGLTAAVKLNNKQARTWINRFGNLAGVSLMIAGFFTNGVSKDPIWNNPPSWFAAICLPCAAGLVIAFAGSSLLRLPSPEAVAVAIECCYQNTGLALTIAISAFPREQVGAAAGVPLVYGMAEIAVILAFTVSAMKAGWTYSPKNAPLWVELLANRQPDAQQEAELAPRRSSENKFPCMR